MKNVFKHYAGMDPTSEAVTLNLDEFTALCTDTKLRLDAASIRRVFTECCEGRSEVRSAGDSCSSCCGRGHGVCSS